MFKLKELRLECGLKRSKVAADLQMNAGTIANYENEIREAPYECLVKFAEYFDVSVDYLLGRNENESPKSFNGGLSAEETALVKNYRSLSPLAKERISEYIELWQSRAD
ncbi:MAG: helix-turn-helix domain-containing protein [Clostridia bacterium]|nr:helix-turn-helix domain-containing protein [Clostridia bacterium]